MTVVIREAYSDTFICTMHTYTAVGGGVPSLTAALQGQSVREALCSHGICCFQAVSFALSLQG